DAAVGRRLWEAGKPEEHLVVFASRKVARDVRVHLQRIAGHAGGPALRCILLEGPAAPICFARGRQWHHASAPASSSQNLSLGGLASSYFTESWSTPPLLSMIRREATFTSSQVRRTFAIPSSRALPSPMRRAMVPYPRRRHEGRTSYPMWPPVRDRPSVNRWRTETRPMKFPPSTSQ